MSVYIVDTNFFIQSHRVTYPLDVAVGFWEKVKKISNEHRVISIDKVKNEIFTNDDELKKWVEKNLPGSFFKDTGTAEVLEKYREIVNWANAQNYLPAALNEFLSYDIADAWLVAYALSLNRSCCIVTQEKSEPNRLNKIKIPDVCIAFNIEYKNIIEMFRALGEKF